MLIKQKIRLFLNYFYGINGIHSHFTQQFTHFNSVLDDYHFISVFDDTSTNTYSIFKSNASIDESIRNSYDNLTTNDGFINVFTNGIYKTFWFSKEPICHISEPTPCGVGKRSSISDDYYFL
jgi:hypothetical protein